MILRPYQVEDVKFLASLNRGACFNEPRTGKTPTILTVSSKRKLKKVLIICPNSARPVWRDHWEELIGTECVMVHGTRKQKEKQIAQWNTGALIVS